MSLVCINCGLDFDKKPLVYKEYFFCSCLCLRHLTEIRIENLEKASLQYLLTDEKEVLDKLEKELK